jgi:hypothetical protein
VLESYLSTQPEINPLTFGKNELFTFIDHFKKVKKGIPGAGSYFKAKTEVEILKKFSSLPREIRIQRH